MVTEQISPYYSTILFLVDDMLYKFSLYFIIMVSKMTPCILCSDLIGMCWPFYSLIFKSFQSEVNLPPIHTIYLHVSWAKKLRN